MPRDLRLCRSQAGLGRKLGTLALSKHSQGFTALSEDSLEPGTRASAATMGREATDKGLLLPAATSQSRPSLT